MTFTLAVVTALGSGNGDWQWGAVPGSGGGAGWSSCVCPIEWKGEEYWQYFDSRLY